MPTISNMSNCSGETECINKSRYNRFKNIVDTTFEITPKICEEFANADLNVEYCISLVTDLILDEYDAYNQWGPIVLSDGTHLYYGPNSSKIDNEPICLKLIYANEEDKPKPDNKPFDITIVKLFFNDDYESHWHHNYSSYWTARHILRKIISQERFSKKTFEYFDAMFRKRFTTDRISQIEHTIYGKINNY